MLIDNGTILGSNIIPRLTDFSNHDKPLQVLGVNFDLSPWEPKKEDINLEKARNPSFWKRVKNQMSK